MRLTQQETIQKARISVILPKKACVEVREQMLREGYTLREKSKWYSEAIERFLATPCFEDYVEMALLVEERSKPETFYIVPSLDESLNEAIIAVRLKFPALDGVKSLIVRASIIQRLLTALPKVDESGRNLT